MEDQTDNVLKTSTDFKRSTPVQWEEIPSLKSPKTTAIDFFEIKGQYLAKRVIHSCHWQHRSRS